MTQEPDKLELTSDEIDELIADMQNVLELVEQSVDTLVEVICNNNPT